MDLRSLLDPATIANPFPVYERLRSESPVCEIAPRMYAVTRYRDVLWVLKDYETFSARIGDNNTFAMFGPSPIQAEIDEILRECPEVPVLMRSDPPAQQVVRKLVSGVFTTREVEQLEPRIRKLVDELAGSWLGHGRVEFVSQFATPLPSTVTTDALGAEPAMRERLRFWADEVLCRTAGPQSPERQREVARNIAEMSRFFLGMIEERRRRPRGDLVSLLARAELPSGERLDDVAIVNVIVTFLVGGNETTTLLLSSALQRLASEPDLADRLRKQPERIPAFVEEMLRLESPAQAQPREATRDVEIGGTLVPKGSMLMVFFGSANRDAEAFEEPDRLDLARADSRSKPHLAFGFANHFCLGAHLARAEARIALDHLLARMHAITLDPGGAAERTQNFLLRGFTRLDLAFEPA